MKGREDVVIDVHGRKNSPEGATALRAVLSGLSAHWIDTTTWAAVLPRNGVRFWVPAVELALVLEQQAVAVELVSARARRVPEEPDAELLHAAEARDAAPASAAARESGVAQAEAQARAAVAQAAALEPYAALAWVPVHAVALEPVSSPDVALERAEL